MTPDLNRLLDVIRDRRRMLGKKPGQQITLDLELCEGAAREMMRMRAKFIEIHEAGAPDAEEAKS